MEVLKLLEDDSHYYGELGRQYLSNSDIITLLNDPKSFREEKPMSKAMLIGRYFHTKMLEPDKLDSEEYIPIDASSRNTKLYKEGLPLEVIKAELYKLQTLRKTATCKITPIFFIIDATSEEIAYIKKLEGSANLEGLVYFAFYDKFENFFIT